MFRTYRTCNPTMKFSKYKFINKLLDSVKFLFNEVFSVYCWSKNKCEKTISFLNERRKNSEKFRKKKKKTTSIDCLLLANNNAHGPCRVTTHT